MAQEPTGGQEAAKPSEPKPGMAFEKVPAQSGDASDIRVQGSTTGRWSGEPPSLAELRRRPSNQLLSWVFQDTVEVDVTVPRALEILNTCQLPEAASPTGRLDILGRPLTAYNGSYASLGPRHDPRHNPMVPPAGEPDYAAMELRMMAAMSGRQAPITIDSLGDDQKVQVEPEAPAQVVDVHTGEVVETFAEESAGVAPPTQPWHVEAMAVFRGDDPEPELTWTTDQVNDDPAASMNLDFLNEVEKTREVSGPYRIFRFDLTVHFSPMSTDQGIHDGIALEIRSNLTHYCQQAKWFYNRDASGRVHGKMPPRPAIEGDESAAEKAEADELSEFLDQIPEPAKDRPGDLYQPPASAATEQPTGKPHEIVVAMWSIEGAPWQIDWLDDRLVENAGRRMDAAYVRRVKELEAYDEFEIYRFDFATFTNPLVSKGIVSEIERQRDELCSRAKWYRVRNPRLPADVANEERQLPVPKHFYDDSDRLQYEINRELTVELADLVLHTLQDQDEFPAQRLRLTELAYAVMHTWQSCESLGGTGGLTVQQWRDRIEDDPLEQIVKKLFLNFVDQGFLWKEFPLAMHSTIAEIQITAIMNLPKRKDETVYDMVVVRFIYELLNSGVCPKCFERGKARADFNKVIDCPAGACNFHIPADLARYLIQHNALFRGKSVAETVQITLESLGCEMNSLRLKHRLHQCDSDDCNVCRGGLASCEVCGGAEGTLPTECPGRKMSAPEEAAVYSGRWDYDGGRWIELPKA